MTAPNLEVRLMHRRGIDDASVGNVVRRWWAELGLADPPPEVSIAGEPEALPVELWLNGVQLAVSGRRLEQAVVAATRRWRAQDEPDVRDWVRSSWARTDGSEDASALITAMIDAALRTATAEILLSGRWLTDVERVLIRTGVCPRLLPRSSSGGEDPEREAHLRMFEAQELLRPVLALHRDTMRRLTIEPQPAPTSSRLWNTEGEWHQIFAAFGVRVSPIRLVADSEPAEFVRCQVGGLTAPPYRLMPPGTVAVSPGAI